jgi:ArsR family transcriptional regulator, virulence genes transcriptional regulator
MVNPLLSPDIRKSAEHQAMLCRVFSNAQRVLILWLLAEKERTVTEIASSIGASLQSTSQHLRLMELSNIVESRREHHNIFYQTASNELLRDCLVLANRPKEHLFEAESEA